MSTMRLCILLILKMILSASGLFAFAQQQSQWVGDLYLVHTFSRYQYDDTGTLMTVDPRDMVCVLIDAENNIKKSLPVIAKIADIPEQGMYERRSMPKYYWYNDALYTFIAGAVERNEDGAQFRRWGFAKWQNDEWHFLGEYKADPGIGINAIPADNDRFIVVSGPSLTSPPVRTAQPTANAGAAVRAPTNANVGPDYAPFARMSILAGRKEIRLDNPIGHGQDELQKEAGAAFLRGLVQLPAIVTGKYAAILQSNTGLYWVFSLEKASLVKAGNIFKQVTPEMIAKGGFPGAILGSQPEIGGTVLIAAQQESYLITETMDMREEMDKHYRANRSLSFEEAGQIRKRLQEEFIERNPYIDWYRLYPENGRVEKLSEPPEGGTQFRKEYGQWRPMPNGSVKMGNYSNELLDKFSQEPKQTDKQSDGDDKR